MLMDVPSPSALHSRTPVTSVTGRPASRIRSTVTPTPGSLPTRCQSALLGHSSATITLGVYSHLWPTAEDRTRAAAGDLMAAALGARADSLRTETL